MTTGSQRAEVHGIPDFWDRVEAAVEFCLVLDYDGTLAPFREDRMEAHPLDGVVRVLESIRDAGRTQLVMVTGRPLRELLELVGDLGITMVGSHGSEFRMPDGTTQRHELTLTQKERLTKATDEAKAVAPAERVERKVASVALHTRGMPEKRAREMRDAVCAEWSTDADAHDLECRRFSGGVELRLKGTDKGTALQTILKGCGEDALCIYIGDDETDEDAFAAILGRGVGIRVGPPGADTGALGTLENPRAVRDFLETWMAVTTI